MNLICAKCDSTNVAGRLRVTGTGVDRFGFTVPLSIVTHDEPDALLFKKPQAHQIHARVCRDCGHTELYVDTPETLRTAQH